MKSQQWGIGGPQLVKPATTDTYETVVGFFDLHRPQHDALLWLKSMEVMKEIRPHRYVIGGDGSDFSLISRWQEKRRAGMPQGKVDRMVRNDMAKFAEGVFGEIRKIDPDAVIDFCEGNHDERARLWMDDDLETGIEEFKSAMQFDQYDVNWHPRAGFRLRDEFIIRHGNYTVMHNAKKEFDTTKCGGWSGHKHQRTFWEETHHETMRRWEWTVAPVMSRVDYDYGPGQSGLAQWPQGFLLGMFSTRNQYDYHTEVARYWDHKLMVRGNIY